MPYNLDNKYKEIFDSEKDNKKLMLNILNGKTQFDFNEFIKIYNEDDRKFLYSFFNENGVDISKESEKIFYIENVKYFLDDVKDLTVFCENKNGQIVLNCTVMRFSITPLIGYRGFKCKIIINNKVDIEKFIDVMMKDFEEFRNIIDEYAEQNDELSNSLDKKSDLEKNTTDTAVNIVGDVLDILGDIIKIIDENK